MTTGPTMVHSPAKRSAVTSPEEAPLLKNLKIDQRTGVPKTSAAEKRHRVELLAGRGKGKPKESEESKETEEEVRKKKSPPRRPSRDLVAKKKTSGRATIGKGRKLRKGGVPSVAGAGKKVLPKKVPSRKDSNRKHAGGKGFTGTGARGFQHGSEYYTTDDQGWVFDQYGCQVFRDDEESSDEEGVPGTEERGDEEDSEEIPLVEIAKRQAQGEPGDEVGQGDEEETEKSEIE